MTSREIVAQTLRFETPERVPRNLWILPSAYLRHGERLAELLRRYPQDLNPPAPGVPELPAQHRKGMFKDTWGSVWLNLQDGIVGEVKKPAIERWSDLATFRPPPHWTDSDAVSLRKMLDRAPDAFILLGGGRLFERLQHLRGSQNLYLDLAEQPKELLRLRGIVMEYLHKRVEECLKQPCDGVDFSDDWGSQRGLLIHPKLWREFFKPCYAELFKQVHRSGRFVFMHSDGSIMEIIEDLIEIGVNALNSQVWIMGLAALGARYRGRITFWGEVNRQTTLPHGTPGEVRDSVRTMKEQLGTPRGGLIAQSEVDALTPLENIEAVLQPW